MLKNIGKRNLIPVIDFEEFNKASGEGNPYASGLSNNSARPFSFQINYLMVYLASSLRTLAPESSTSVLFSLPSSTSDDIVFYPYPHDRLIDYREVDKMLT